MDATLIKPGLLLGSYPEKTAQQPSRFDDLILYGYRKFTSLPIRQRMCASEFARDVVAVGNHLENADISRLLSRMQVLREQLRTQGAFEGAGNVLLIETFAIVRELSFRVLGMRHYPNQIMSGWLILNGMLAEMATGEGKTLTAGLPACVAALAGTPVHVLTTTDYLASRDADELSPLYTVLGLNVGVVTEDMENSADRRAAYACDVTYTTNKQLGFDYLRDQTATRKTGRLSRLIDSVLPETYEPVLRGLCFAIVDEADSVLIDEARTPLILTRALPDNPNKSFYMSALTMAEQLVIDKDYTVNSRKVVLSAFGRDKIDLLCEKGIGFWTIRRNREEIIRLALTAKHLFIRDQHYLVDDGKIHIIDTNTGRRMSGRSWERGLHQLIETREGLDISPITGTIGKISYQQLFSRYLRLGAMSGTAAEVGNELLETYGLQVVPVPNNHLLLRENKGGQVLPDKEAKLAAIVERIGEIHRTGQPILVGTRTVQNSEELSERLTAAGLKHRVLNARQDEEEADIVAEAGQQGRITIATNMAGRGTDIKLGEGVAELGGLHVLVTEHNEAHRLDRQLIGRSARQGDPGTYETFFCPDDEIVNRSNVKLLKLLSNSPYSVGYAVVRLAQWWQEFLQRRSRKQLTGMDQRVAEGLSFGRSV